MGSVNGKPRTIKLKQTKEPSIYWSLESLDVFRRNARMNLIELEHMKSHNQCHCRVED